VAPSGIDASENVGDSCIVNRAADSFSIHAGRNGSEPSGCRMTAISTFFVTSRRLTDNAIAAAQYTVNREIRRLGHRVELRYLFARSPRTSSQWVVKKSLMLSATEPSKMPT
jgi:hypothetical protein